jgi:hypothetical protein
LPLPHDPGPHWGEVGIHGLHRPRDWDVVTTVEAPSVAGSDARFVVLDRGRILVEDGPDDPSALADAVTLPPPYRANAVRQDGPLWVVAARGIETVRLEQDPGGARVEVTWDGTERTVRIDGEPTLAGLPELERIGAARHASYVVTAGRLDGETWEILVSPL